MDPLLVFKPEPCQLCWDGHWKRRRHKRKRCESCHHTGYAMVDLSGLWKNKAGFLVCGGPSLNDYPLDCLRERGVVSLGINNAAAYAPCRAFTFHDGQEKFHQALYLDPNCLAFVPAAKLGKRFRARVGSTLRYVDYKLEDCPGVFGYSRSIKFDAATFLTTSYAHAGCKPVSSKPMSFLLGFRLLHYLGVRRIYLLGVDLQRPYAWNPEDAGGPKYWATQRYCELLRPQFEKAGLFCYQVNPKSRCSAFDHVPWDVAIDDCRGPIPKEPLDCTPDWYSKRVKAEQLELYPEQLTYDELVRAERGRKRARELSRLRSIETGGGIK